MCHHLFNPSLMDKHFGLFPINSSIMNHLVYGHFTSISTEGELLVKEYNH